VADDTLKLTRDQRIGKKVVGASVDCPEVVWPVSCPGNHNQRYGRPKRVSNTEQILIAAIAKRVLADNKATVTFGDIEDGLLYCRRKGRRNAAMEKSLTERAADGLLPANDKTLWKRPFAGTLPQCASVRIAQAEIASDDFPFNGRGTVFKSIHDILPCSIGKAVARELHNLRGSQNKSTAVKLSGELPQPQI
jgi:hypothetical protein